MGWQCYPIDTQGSISVHFYPYGWELTTSLDPIVRLVLVVTCNHGYGNTNRQRRANDYTDCGDANCHPTATLAPNLEPTALPTATPSRQHVDSCSSVSMEETNEIVHSEHGNLRTLEIRWGTPVLRRNTVWDGMWRG